MWEDSSYFWVVLCKNHCFHARKNLFVGHRIPLAETDAFTSRPPVIRPFKVRCDDCGKEYVYKPAEVLRVEDEPSASFTPHPLFRDEADPNPGESDPEKSQLNIESAMQIERRRATRHLFGGAVEVIHVESQKQLTSHTRDLSLYGCFVTSKAPFPKGTGVRLKITNSKANFSAVGHVAYNLPDEGMGIAFVQVKEPTMNGDQRSHSKRYTISTAVSKAQYDYVIGRAKDKGITVSNYVRNLLKIGLQVEQSSGAAVAADIEEPASGKSVQQYKWHDQ